MRSIHLPSLISCLCSPRLSLRAQTVSDSGTFVVRHARDTVATEQFTPHAPPSSRAPWRISNAKRTSQRWTAVVAPDATLPLIEVTVREGSDSGGQEARIVQRARVIFKEDSAAVDAIGGDGIQTRLFATERGAVPYLNLSFALLEQAVRRARATPQISARSPSSIWAAVRRSLRQLSRLAPDSLRLDIGTVQYHLRVDHERPRAGRADPGSGRGGGEAVSGT